ncbi:hypothetical protein PENTCL1PPCAC_8387, partial [Pristionchus entomophagus]
FRKFCNIVGFHDGVMTVTCNEGGECDVMTARLPHTKNNFKHSRTSQKPKRESLLQSLKWIASNRRTLEQSKKRRRESN